ncbi:hypothetical protein CLV54_1412 [Compostimonas suwonensis]|uniref:Uncharacterized protein n=1 Tax=Compostimonas suwonensis TaxID=1048394 RepID=A0A2M9C087_9MICO|nr:hypothetical protein CLV54_1412 [Compostimonas suwonensis]
MSSAVTDPLTDTTAGPTIGSEKGTTPCQR